MTLLTTIISVHRCHQPPRVARDHEFFVRRNHPCCHPAALRTDAWAALLVRGAIELDSDPCSVAADSFPDCRAVLADSGGENQRIEPAQCRNKGSQLAPDSIQTDVHRDPCFWF